ncbi:unnamed protein product [Tilletia controversa]|nr:unnamed protein product [Tilletia controversa]CAD6984554.1 unnamed protein product [Tilletia controversa]
MASTATASLGALPFDAAAPIWADVEPVPQADTESPLCPILYAPEYSKAMDLLRAFMLKQERSARALALTEHLVKLNPSNYTVWDYRAQLLVAGADDDGEDIESAAGGAGGGSGSDSNARRRKALEAELALLDDMAAGSMKNYQIWQQRKRVVSALGDPSRELEFTASILDIDAKNYHTWVYRQWVLCFFGGLPPTSALRDTSTASAPPPVPVPAPTYSAPSAVQPNSGEAEAEAAQGTFPQLWDGELAFTDGLLESDVRNNSAWNHRFFVLFASGRARETVADREGTNELEWVRREVGFAKSKIALTPNNASAWNYLRGICRLNPSQSPTPFTTSASSFALSLIPSHAEATATPTVDSGGKTSWLALEWLLDCEEERAKVLVAGGKAGDSGEGGLADIEQVVQVILQRLLIADPMRKRYWHYKAERTMTLLGR